MKKIIAGFLALMMVLSLFGCNSDTQTNTKPISTEIETQATEVTKPIVLENEVFPDGTTICGVNVGKLGKDDAFKALKTAAANYSLNLTVNDRTITLTADDMKLSVSKDKFDAFFKALNDGEKQPKLDLFSIDEDSVRNAVTSKANTSPSNATIEYNSSAGVFQIKSAASGQEISPEPVLKPVKEAVAVLKTTATATAEVTEIKPQITEKSSEAINGQKNANDYLKLSLKYTYSPQGVAAKTQALTKSDIASFITFNAKLVPDVSKSAIESYAYKMNEKYHVPGETGKFVTTGSSTINVEVTYAGQQVDIEALRDDIYYRVKNKLSGTRTAPYLSKSAVKDMSFGGNYVEIDMSSQQLWVYKNGKCVVSTPVVTGTAYNGMITPQGVYKINNKKRNATLYGENYVTTVSYWMAFIGNGYGLHDASWRPYSDFGGDTYLYNGSHGCVNIPISVMPDVYNNAEVGTHVILYGGATNASPLKQSFSGKTEVSTTLDKSFMLNVKPKYDVDGITYSVANSKILSVSGDGTVTPKAIGTTTVTVTSPKQPYYTKATYKVTVTVKSPCDSKGHTYKTWQVITKPTCTEPGIEKSTCTVCKKTVKREIPAISHSFVDNKEFCLNGCKTKNPNYIAPTESTTAHPTTEGNTEHTTE